MAEITRKRSEAIVTAQWMDTCSGEWYPNKDNIVRCTECRSIHPEQLLALPLFGHVATRSISFGHHRIEIYGILEMPTIFDSRHIPSFGEDQIVAVLDKLKAFTFMEWQFRSRTKSAVCWLPLRTIKMTREQSEAKAEAENYFIQAHARGKPLSSILYPDAVHCLARRGES